MSNTPPVKRRRFKPILWIGTILVLLGGITAASVAHHFQHQAQAETKSSAPPPRALRIHALGRLEPAGTVLKIFPPSGNDGTRVEKLLVNEGDDIPANALVAVLDNEKLRQASLVEAEARLQLAQTRLEQVKAGAKAGDIAAQQLSVDLHAEQMKVADRELKRALELSEKKIITKEDFDNKQWIVDRIKLEHRRSLEQLKSVKEVRDIDVRVAEREVASSQAAVRRAGIDLETTQVRSPSAGRVLKIHTHSGERISDQGLLELGDVLHMEAVAEVFEADVTQLTPGLPAIVKVDCLEKPIPGEVAQIGHRVARKVVLTNDPVSDTDARVVEVRIRLAPDEIQRVVRLSNARVEVTIELPHDSPSTPPAR